MTCTVGTCVMSSAEFILSSDSLTIYSFFLYQDGTVLYFAALSTSTGTASLRYKKTAAVSGIQGSVLSGDYIIRKSF